MAETNELFITPEKVVVPLRHAVKVQGKLYGRTFEANREKRYFRFTSDYEETPKIIQFNEVESFSCVYDPKNYLWIVGLASLFLFVGIFILLFKMAMPKYKTTFIMKNKENFSFRLHIDQQTAMALENVFRR